jgi:hypothetical protein
MIARIADDGLVVDSMWSRGVTSLTLGAVILFTAPASWGLEASPHGAGTIEARIQTPTNASAWTLSLANHPGVFYDPESGDYWLNLIAGGGYFLSDAFAIGLDVGYQRSVVRSERLWYATLAPFAKVVTGLDEGKFGFFAEMSPGMLFTNDPLVGRGKHFLLNGWLGLNLPVGRTMSLMMGPNIMGIGNVVPNEGFPSVVGWRLGIAIYLSGPEPPNTAASQKQKSMLPPFEVRIHSASNVAGGGGLFGAAQGRGAFYATRPKLLIANLTAGGGAFLLPWLALGFDYAQLNALGRVAGISYPFIESYTFSPFVKFVTGMEARSLGVFAELSPGLVLARQLDVDDPFLRYDRFTGLQLTAWAGAHIPAGRSAAFVAGPTAAWVEDLERFGDRGNGYIGFRFGMSAFVP